MMILLAIVTQLITSGIIWAIFFFWSTYISLNYFNSNNAIEIIKIFSFFFIGVNLFQIISTFFMSVQNTFLNKMMELCRMLSILIFTLTIFLLDRSGMVIFSYWWLFGLAVGVVISYSVFYIKYYRVYLRWVPMEIDFPLLKNIFTYAVTVFIGLQAATLLGQIDMQMIIYFLWSTSAGYYTIYLSIIWIPFMVLWPIFWFLFPVVSELTASQKMESISALKKVFQKIFILSAIFVSTFFFVFADKIVFVLFWEKFVPAWEILQFSIFFLMFNFLLQINFNIMSWVWYIKQRVYIIFAAIAFNIITNIILIQYFWVAGAALATWMWWVLIWLSTEYVLRIDFPAQLDYSSTIKNIIVMSTAWIGAYSLGQYFIVDSRVFSLIILWWYFILFLWVFLYINKYELRSFINQVRLMRRKKL